MPATKNLPNFLRVNSQKNNEISIYRGELTQQNIVKGVAMIKRAFPSLPLDFYDVFIDRIKENGFNDERLMAAIYHVIDNCIYPTPTIANFIGFDSKIKLYSYEEMVGKVEEFGPGIWDSYRMKRLPGREKPVWVHIDEEQFLQSS